MADEPELAWVASGRNPDNWGSPETLATIYAAIRSADETNPVALVTWARPLPEYANVTNYYMNDWYPRDCKLPFTNTCTGSKDIGEFNYMTRASYDIWGTGIRFVEQRGLDGYLALAWGQDYANAVVPKPGMRNMTRNELRYHVYTAVVQGADGVLFWKEEWASAPVKELVYEIAAELGSIGMQMQYGASDGLVVGAPASDLAYRYGVFAKTHTILAVNINGHGNANNVDPASVGNALAGVRFQLPDGARPERVTVVGEDRTLPVSDGVFVDDFARYQVHIYTWDETISTPTPTRTATSVATSSPTPSPTPTRTPTPTEEIWTPQPTASSSPTASPTPTQTATPGPVHVYCDCVCVTVTPTP